MSGSDEISTGLPRHVDTSQNPLTWRSLAVCFLLAWPHWSELLHPQCSTKVASKETLVTSKSPLPLPLRLLPPCLQVL